jgi:hypothetical protein
MLSLSNRNSALFSTLVFVAASLTSVAASAHDRDRDREVCNRVQGEFFSTLFGGPECSSPVGICTDGTLLNSFLQSYDFAMGMLNPAGDPENPNKFVYTGSSIIIAHGGEVLVGDDTGHMFFDPVGLSPFVTTANVVSGTGRFTGATGYIEATGEVSFVEGTASGTYEGVICRPKGRHDRDHDDRDRDRNNHGRGHDNHGRGHDNHH